MNILPKKRWHVRTKENIARVRRDEAKAREEEAERLKRIELAEKEARTEVLRGIARSKYDGRQDESSTSTEKLEHVNFFKELEEGEDAVKGKNKEYEKEKKEESEKYEKQIGYLTYLGQDTVEATGKVSWFNKAPDRWTNKDDNEVEAVKKTVYDPLEKMNSYLGNKYVSKKKMSVSEPPIPIDKKKKHKTKKNKKKRSRDSRSRSVEDRAKRKRHSSSSEDDRTSKLKKIESCDRIVNEGKRSDLEELRAKRLKREQAEKQRAAQLLARLRGETIEEPKAPEHSVKQKYNSQFNPHIARQNRDD
uniref:Leukocyte receptor cluster member 1 n=2 Tax=Lygus hesperus TaxID=30085 RepID=A0A146M7Y8_LYGHE